MTFDRVRGPIESTTTDDGVILQPKGSTLHYYRTVLVHCTDIDG
jgi:hypothetical protein